MAHFIKISQAQHRPSFKSSIHMQYKLGPSSLNPGKTHQSPCELNQQNEAAIFLLLAWLELLQADGCCWAMTQWRKASALNFHLQSQQLKPLVPVGDMKWQL